MRWHCATGWLGVRAGSTCAPSFGAARTLDEVFEGSRPLVQRRDQRREVHAIRLEANQCGVGWLSETRAEGSVWLCGASITAAPWPGTVARKVLGSSRGRMQARLPVEHIYCRLA